ncbi:MAG: N-acetylmuramoyl-L-alanine amidase [Myxococcales bacterium]|nr:N-acetylmuramoyl-L-alanine amidase [Myxococcales bacterium]
MAAFGFRSHRVLPLALLLLMLVLLLPGLLGVTRPKGMGSVTDVRTWSHPDYTRVVVELTQPVETEVKRLTADAKAGRPDRLYLDLEGIWVGRDFEDGIPIQDGLLQDLRLGQNTLGKARLVIDLQRYDRHRLLILRSPHRVVVDVYGPRSGGETLQWPRPEGSLPNSRLSIQLRPIRTVVIDPGHGGKDPGAIGIGGLREKDVNLRLAKMIGERLEHRGFTVVFTRSKDLSLSLEERTVIAEAAYGDIFVSIHANASTRRGTRGIEIYSLDENHERHSLDVAARENGVSRSEVDSLQRAMAKLHVSEVSEHSVRLAKSVHDSLMPGLRKKYREVPDLGVKKGPFYVLFLSSMPAILLESGFLTNKHDAKLLRDKSYLMAMAEHIAAGLGDYRSRGQQVAKKTGIQ